jgi:hypothetical protein
MNLRPVRKTTALDIEQLLEPYNRGGKSVNISFGETSYLPSIWAMELPNEAYTAPRGAFWFVSTGLGR